MAPFNVYHARRRVGWPLDAAYGVEGHLVAEEGALAREHLAVAPALREEPEVEPRPEQHVRALLEVPARERLAEGFAERGVPSGGDGASALGRPPGPRRFLFGPATQVSSGCKSGRCALADARPDSGEIIPPSEERSFRLLLARGTRKTNPNPKAKLVIRSLLSLDQ